MISRAPLTVLAALAWSAPAAAQVAGHNGLPCAYATIQDAIDAVNPPTTPTTIVVAAGSYAETLQIHPNMDIQIVPGTSACAAAPGTRLDLTKSGTFGHVIDVLELARLVVHDADIHDGISNGAGGNIAVRSGSEVELHDCTITGGQGNGGGGIYIGDYDTGTYNGPSTVTLYRTTLNDNHAVLPTTGNIYGHGGAAWVGDTHTLLMKDDSAIGNLLPNTALYEGGAVYLETQLSILELESGTRIRNGEAGLIQYATSSYGGGCIGGNGTVVLLDGSFVDHCNAPGDGGAIKADSVWMHPQANVFSATAGGDGGAIYARGVNLFDGAKIYDAHAGNDGGAIYAVVNAYLEGASIIEDSTAGRDGGAIWSPTVDLSGGVLLQRNTADQGGGCIYGTDVTLDDADLLTCDATTGNGGGILATNVTLTNGSTLTDGYAGGSGGLAYVRRFGSLTAGDTVSLTVGDAGASGGLVHLGEDTIASFTGDVQLSSGTAGTSGGLVHFGSGTLDIRNDVSFTYGLAGDGGLLWIGPGSDATVGRWTLEDTEQIVFANGTADADGGAIHVEGSPTSTTSLRMWHKTVVRASSASNGGGISIRDASLELYEDVGIGVLGEGNIAGGSGGGIYALDSDVVIGGSVVEYDDFDTWAVPTGGTRVEYNEAGVLGGGIALAGDAGGSFLSSNWLVLATNTVTGASGSGGGLALTGGSLADLQHGIIQDNKARRGGGVHADGSTFIFADPGSADECYWATLAPDRYCAEITGNHAKDVGTVDNYGGAVHSTDSTITLDRVAVQLNTAGTDGTALYFGSNTAADLENTLVAGTNDAVHRSVVVSGTSSMDATMSTFTDEGTTLRFEAGATGALHGSIVWPHNGFGNGLVMTGATVTGTCNVGMGGAPFGGGNYEGPPLFTITSRGKYRLSASSPAIDLCNSGPLVDLDYSQRAAPYDAGAFTL